MEPVTLSWVVAMSLSARASSVLLARATTSASKTSLTQGRLTSSMFTATIFLHHSRDSINEVRSVCHCRDNPSHPILTAASFYPRARLSILMLLRLKLLFFRHATKIRFRGHFNRLAHGHRLFPSEKFSKKSI